MERYYKPYDSEFCVGFIYEAYIPERNCWSVESFHLNDSHIKLIRENKIRVKYLNKEDIESLGWKLKEEEVKQTPYKSNFCGFIKNKNELHIQLENVNGNYPNKLTIRGPYLNINPLIKNKSELVKLMKQLDI